MTDGYQFFRDLAGEREACQNMTGFVHGLPADTVRDLREVKTTAEIDRVVSRLNLIALMCV